MELRERVVEGSHSDFVFRVRMGDYEIEIRGAHEEVMDTIKKLEGLVADVHKAFENVKPKTVATLTVKTQEAKEDSSTVKQKYPRITAADTCDEALLRILETDWGKWRPRTIDELKDALKANGVQYPSRVLASVLTGLERQEKIRRWKTDSGYVYILAEKEALA
jgi:hypothetical protein